MRRHQGARNRGFSLLEVVIVVAIIAILAAIGIPRMSRGARGASDSALTADLATLRNAIDLYAAEHGGAFPNADDPTNQLTQYTDAIHGVSAIKDGTHIYGPYMRSIPPLPVGTRKGNVGIDAPANAAVAGVGWLYDKSNGKISANAVADEKDEADKLYTDY
jgi:prepilin-type N-terminal cleavage/methylation domain-containing protein